MAHFDDIIWPEEILVNSVTTPHDSTLQISTPNRARKVINRYSQKFRTLVASTHTLLDDTIYQTAFDIWKACGTTDSFLVRDHSDWNSSSDQNFQTAAVSDTDQVLKNTATLGFTGDGVTSTFFLGKNYTQGSKSTFERVRAVDPSTLVVAIDGTPTTSFVLLEWGIISFTDSPGPDNGAVVTAGFEYYVPVHIAADDGFKITMPDFRRRLVSGVRMDEELLEDNFTIQTSP